MIFVFGLFVGAVIGMIITCCVSVEKIENLKRINGDLIHERNNAIRLLRESNNE